MRREFPGSTAAIALAASLAALVWAIPAGADPSGSDAGGEPHVPAVSDSAPGPQAALADGTWTVGSDLLPGVYASAGPVDGGACYWRRIGADDVTLENALTKKPQVVQIQPTDISFRTNGCQPWQLTDGLAPPGQTPPWLAQLQLRQQLDMLNGLAGQSGNGQLPPY